MTARLVIAIIGLAIGPGLGDGVKEAKKLVSESKDGELEAMKVLDLVTGDLTEEGVDQVIGWVIENGGAEERKRVGEVVSSIPRNDRLMLKYVRVLGFFGEKQQLEAVIGKMDKGSLQQEARFELVSLVAEDAERNLTLTDAERAAGNQEAVGLLEKLGKEESLNEQLGKRVEKMLFKVTHLVVGCEAPEIEGVDHDGDKFRLSEYRGKVVLLPFWGFW
jgi:predicted ArsR family transcriptional regulator